MLDDMIKALSIEQSRELRRKLETLEVEKMKKIKYISKCKRSGKYIIKVPKEGKRVILGSFDKIEDAYEHIKNTKIPINRTYLGV